MRVIDCIQGTDEWLQARLGKVTASNFGKVLAKGDGKSRATYMDDLLTEFDEGTPTEHICTKYMEAGTKKEPVARGYYEDVNKCTVEQIGFIEFNDFVGGSPDGLVGDDGIIEIKCPTASVHRSYYKETKKPCKAYRDQMQGLLWITGRKWCDFVSFRPESKNHPYWSTIYMRDEKYIKEMEIQVTMFVTELKEMIKQLTVSEF